MTIKLRMPVDADWPAILQLADEAVPWDHDGNREWLENRRLFAGKRVHYVAEDSNSDELAGYGALEEGPETGVFRIFVVMSVERLHGETGDLVYNRLANDLEAHSARGVWAREYASDSTIIPFFEERGFVEENRFTLPGEEEMVVLTLRME